MTFCRAIDISQADIIENKISSWVPMICNVYYILKWHLGRQFFYLNQPLVLITENGIKYTYISFKVN